MAGTAPLPCVLRYEHIVSPVKRIGSGLGVRSMHFYAFGPR